ncbi:MAG: CYTH domain-containing protein [Bacteroidia bacterium]
MVFTWLASSTVWAQGGEFDPGGYNSMRVENEIKLVVPIPQQDSVWAYLKQRYTAPSAFLAGLDSSLHAVWAEDLFFDQYFDNPEFKLVTMQSGVRHRRREVLTDPTSRKDGRELMQIKVNDIDHNELNRGEYKYPVKHYKPGGKVVEYDDHPFLGLVKRKHRANVIAQLQQIGIKAQDLLPTIMIRQYRKRLYVLRDTLPFATITLDIDSAFFEGKSHAFTEMEMELNEISYTLGDSAERQRMEGINDRFREDLLARFPSIHQDQTPKYTKSAIAFGIDPKTGKLPGKPFPWNTVLWFAGITLPLLAFLIVMRGRIRSRRKSTD